MEIVGKRFSPEEFRAYVEGLDLWAAQFIVLHNTGDPTMAMRPDGFTEEMMGNLLDYYQNTMNWHAGPHLFIDQNGIWVFSPLTAAGVHSPSWNTVAFGVEMLGDFDTEEFGGSVQGQAIRANAVAAIAILSHAAGIDSHTMKLHKEDPLTTHRDCPGANVDKADFIQRVHNYIVGLTT